eukprot:GHVS01035695.1.p1 GENE.GHVS01035695.1~~GHVS01035695.1.p1  ORF type:complete len:761 (+),score=123.45 GHVS01035695.1:299-2581(+)
MVGHSIANAHTHLIANSHTHLIAGRSWRGNEEEVDGGGKGDETSEGGAGKKGGGGWRRRREEIVRERSGGSTPPWRRGRGGRWRGDGAAKGREEAPRESKTKRHEEQEEISEKQEIGELVHQLSVAEDDDLSKPSDFCGDVRLACITSTSVDLSTKYPAAPNRHGSTKKGLLGGSGVCNGGNSSDGNHNSSGSGGCGSFAASQISPRLSGDKSYRSDSSYVAATAISRHNAVAISTTSSSGCRNSHGVESDVSSQDRLEYTPPTSTTHTPDTTSSCPNSTSTQPHPPFPTDPLPLPPSLISASSNSVPPDMSGSSTFFSGRIAHRLDAYFHIASRGSTIKTELRAGLILYTTMCYIIVVNPGILSAAGLPQSSVASATAIAAMVGTFITGLFANLPLGIGPGMGLNTYFAYELVQQQFMPSSSQAFACSCTAGVIFLSLAMCGVCNKLIGQIPLAMKKAVVVGIGLFQALVGLCRLGIIVHPAATTSGLVTTASVAGIAGGTTAGGIGGLLELGSLGGAEQVMGACTLAMLGLFMVLEIPAAILLGIVGSTAISVVTGLAPLPQHMWSHSLPSSESTSSPASSFFSSFLSLPSLDFAGAFSSSRGWICTCFILFVVFVDTGGVMLGMASQADELTDDNTGDIINSKRGYIAVGATNVVAALIGTSPVIIFLESAAAISQGGRTGLCALVASSLFGLSLFFVPLLAVIPASATSTHMQQGGNIAFKNGHTCACATVGGHMSTKAECAKILKILVQNSPIYV